MTIGRWIFVRRGQELDVGLIAHELVHVQQWREHRALPFLTRYVGEYLRSPARTACAIGPPTRRSPSKPKPASAPAA